MLRWVTFAFLLAACDLYGNSQPDAEICAGPAAGDDIPANSLRNPDTGQCQSIPYDCEPCGPCSPPAQPDWASCQGPCESQTEAQCLASTTCHTAYLDQAFWGCFDLPPSGAVTGGGCTALDSQTCSEHPDCVSDYSDGGSGAANATYTQCAPNTPPPACSTLTTAAACSARTDCEPIYDGTQCTCDPSGCMCQDETFDHCQSN